MSLYSFHLAAVPPMGGARAMLRAPTARTVDGLAHAECMSTMQLGAPTVSPARLQLGQLAMFARWHDADALAAFLADHELGRRLAGGWHVRMQFLRRWGHLQAVADLPAREGRWSDDDPVVAVTLARMKLGQLPRFLKWGKPVERLVRDHPGTTLALAAMRPPRTVCTFSVWETVADMVDMVWGNGNVAEPNRHVDAMAERTRKRFHHEFVTLRFRPLSEHGTWDGRTGIIPN